MLDAAELESRGRPTLTLVEERFRVAAGFHAELVGLPDIPLLVEPEPESGTLQHNPEGVVEAGLEAIQRAFTMAPGNVEVS